MKLLKIYNVKTGPKLRAKIKINGKITTVWCGKSIPQLSPGSFVSLIQSVENPKIEITHESGVEVLSL